MRSKLGDRYIYDIEEGPDSIGRVTVNDRTQQVIFDPRRGIGPQRRVNTFMYGYETGNLHLEQHQIGMRADKSARKPYLTCG